MASLDRFAHNRLMTTQFYFHPICLEHDTGAFHPERSDRLRAVMAALEGPAFEGLERLEAPQAERTQIERVHPPQYIDTIFDNVPESGHIHIDGDTVMSPQSGEAALRAVGGVCAAVDAVVEGRATNAFCALRPPGHHAEPATGMGFCLFNNVAIGALQAKAVHGLERVAVVDFDVHHGNGTQATFETIPGFMYVSSHQSPAYPGTGAASDCGPHGNILNVPLPPGTGSDVFRQVYQDSILPQLRNWSPDLLMISAGFDGHARDPLCQLELQDEDYAWVTKELLAVAHDCCQDRVVSVLEGGYDLEALAASTALHVKGLLAVAEQAVEA